MAEETGTPASPATVAPVVPTLTVATATEAPAFPPNTPLEQMTVDQREAYWKDRARKHEDRNKALNGLTPERLKELEAAEARAQQLDYDLASEKDKAVADAKTAATAEARSQFLPRLVEAKFEAFAANRIDPDRLATILEPLDKSKFLTSSGDAVDADKVLAFVNGIAPVTGTQNAQNGPSTSGQGNRTGGTKTAPGMGSVNAGKDLYAETHPSKK